MKKNLNLGVHFTIHFSAYTLPYTSTGNGNGLVPNRWQAITYTPDEDPDAFNAIHAHRADSRFAPSQWETSLQSNAVSHWLGTNLESVLTHVAGGQISPGLNISKNFHLLHIQNFIFFNTDCIWFKENPCQNLLVQLADLLATRQIPSWLLMPWFRPGILLNTIIYKRMELNLRLHLKCQQWTISIINNHYRSSTWPPCQWFPKNLSGGLQT